MGDGTEQNPLTRKDVLKAIEQNGGTAEKLDLSGAVFEAGIDLSGQNLQGVILRKAKFPTSFEREPEKIADLSGIHLEKADLTEAHLEWADLTKAHLEGANLWHAHLERATLWDIHLEGANLVGTHLEGADLMRTKFSSNVNLEDVKWGNYKLHEENPGYFDIAVASYRHLKMWYTNAGYSDTAAKFYYREKEASRKALKWRSKSSFRHRLTLQASYLVFGHGENWKRVLYWMAGVIFGSAGAYNLFGGLNISHSIYYSVVSFTALGYGSWVSSPPEVWVQRIGAAESFVGVSMMALLLVTFVRKWTR